MSALAIAATTGSDLVLQPTRSPFDPGNQMLGCRRDEIGIDRAAAPDALCAVAVNDDCQSCFAVHQKTRRQVSNVFYRFNNMSATRKASSRLCSRFKRGSQAVS